MGSNTKFVVEKTTLGLLYLKIHINTSLIKNEI